MDKDQAQTIYDNNEKLIAATRKLLSGTSATKEAKLQAFLDHVRSNKRIAINVNAESLLEILETGVYMNVFELGYSESKIQKRYDAYTTPYYTKLNSFIDHIEDAKSIKYGSLNTGGMGITKFPGFGAGTYCLILSESFTKTLNDKIYCLMKFSLEYINTAGALKSNMWKEISTYEHVEHLALKKHKTDIKTTDKSQWPEMISNKRGWLEMLIYNQITIEDIQELRIEKQLYDYIKKLLKQSRDSLNTYAETYAEFYGQIKDICEKNSIRIKPTAK